MKTQSIALTIASGVVAFGFLIFLIKILSRKFRLHSETDSGTKLSYGIHISGILIGGALICAKALPLIPEGFEIQWNQHNESFILDAFQFVATILGFSLVWIAVAYFIVQAFTSILFGPRQEAIEMERDNFSFFASKAVAFIGLSIIAGSVIESFLRLFMPVPDVPFYH